MVDRAPGDPDDGYSEIRNPRNGLTFERLELLSREAQGNSRRRLNMNLHASYSEPVQRLFNAICPESYIRPHRHSGMSGVESLIAVIGGFAFFRFDDRGRVVEMLRFGTRVANDRGFDRLGVEIRPEVWHTVVALTNPAILLEVKAGPFDPDAAKQFAPWAPAEGAPDAAAYHAQLCLDAVAGSASVSPL